MTLRNFGISAHIDAGKTTLAERILFLAGRTRVIRDIRGRDGTPVLDHDAIEARRGISIHAAATTVHWGEAQLNLIDTPGHVDFTAEVERALRVLDGAVLVLDAVSGVQAQTVTVVRQMDRYGVPRIAFINKMDKEGADPDVVLDTMRDRLGAHPVLLQWPIGAGKALSGVVDLVSETAWTFEGPGGSERVEIPVPADLVDVVAARREAMLDALSLHSDALTEQLLEGVVDEDSVHDAVRAATLSGALVPVLVGSAFRNLGVQPLLDAVVRYLPEPTERTLVAHGDDGEVSLVADPDAPPIAYAFKVEETDHGRVTWVRVVQGTLRRGERLVESRTGAVVRVGRLARLHAGDLEPLEVAAAGELVALFGADVSFGDTLCAEGISVTLELPQVPEPVVEVAVHRRSGSADALGRALARVVREDPTIRVSKDDRSGEIRMRGMGELHLEVIAERLQQRHRIEVELGPPSVAWRQSLVQRVPFDTLLKQQNGGSGHYARITGFMEPSGEHEPFTWSVEGGAIPTMYRKSVERGFADAIAAGLDDVPLHGARVVVTGGAAHSDDSSEQAFYRAARMVVREVLGRGPLVRLEPVMDVHLEADDAYQGAVMAAILRRRGVVTGSGTDGRSAAVDAQVPLAEMFGFSNVLRSATSGTGTFDLRFSHYAPA
jgi:elongation factor G